MWANYCVKFFYSAESIFMWDIYAQYNTRGKVLGFFFHANVLISAGCCLHSVISILTKLMHAVTFHSSDSHNFVLATFLSVTSFSKPHSCLVLHVSSFLVCHCYSSSIPLRHFLSCHAFSYLSLLFLQLFYLTLSFLQISSVIFLLIAFIYVTIIFANFLCLSLSFFATFL
jgi:hypothetical protein